VVAGSNPAPATIKGISMAEIFVFGSNLLGIHKRGAALHALQNHGAILGQGIGLQGTSYAIPTKETPARSLDLVQINKFVADFLNYAYYTPEHVYHVTQIGCGLAGWHPNQIAPMFKLVKWMTNVKITHEFANFIENSSDFPDLITTFSDQ
jgi:hypothetical protein